MTPKLKAILDQAEASATEYLRQEGRLLLDIIEVERTKAYRCFGMTYLTTYCEKKLRLSENVAQTFVRIVNKSIVVPELADAVVRGEIKITKAKTIASVITKENKSEWIEKAESLSKFELEKEVLKA